MPDLTWTVKEQIVLTKKSLSLSESVFTILIASEKAVIFAVPGTIIRSCEQSELTCLGG